MVNSIVTVAGLYVLVSLLYLVQADVNQAELPDCEDKLADFMYTAEPRDVTKVDCRADDTATFPCMYQGSLAHPTWTINSTTYTSINLPPDHSYSAKFNVLRVSNVKLKNGTTYQCFIPSSQSGVTCLYRSDVGRLILNCKDFNVQNFASYRYDNKTLKEITTQVTAFEANISQMITYVNSDNTSMMCGSTTINSSSCMGGICNHTFDIQSSFCPNNTNITVTATPLDTNSTKSPETNRIDAVNEFVELNFTMLPLSVNCTFINQPREGEKSCEIEVRPECENITYTSKGSVYDSSFVKVTVDVNDLSMRSIDKFCFVLKGSNGTKRVYVEGEIAMSATLTQTNHSLTTATMFLFVVSLPFFLY